jgi:HSP20 family protein
MYKRTYGFTPRNFSGFIEDVLQNGYNRVNEELSAYTAPVNIHETDKTYEMQLSAAGLKKEDFKINVDQNILHISYEHKAEEQQTKWLRNEFRQKSFKRSFTLNDKVDTQHISAKYTDGVLYITLAKKEESVASAHDISVN